MEWCEATLRSHELSAHRRTNLETHFARRAKVAAESISRELSRNRRPNLEDLFASSAKVAAGARSHCILVYRSMVVPTLRMWNGVKRHCLSMTLSRHRRPNVEAHFACNGKSNRTGQSTVHYGISQYGITDTT